MFKIKEIKIDSSQSALNVILHWAVKHTVLVSTSLNRKPSQGEMELYQK